MQPIVLYRKGMDYDADSNELDVIRQYFPVVHQRTEVLKDSLVIGRYSVLPFYLELEKDILKMGGKLINSFRQHQFIADMKEWCEVLGDMTPKLYERLQDLPEKGPFVLKGQTNSKKHLWDTHMFAHNRKQAGEVYSRLADDALIGQQTIYARDFVPLVQLMKGFNDLPITEEYRFFIYNNTILSGGFYWSSHVADLPTIPDIFQVPVDFLNEAIKRIGDNASFYTLDVARAATGKWIVIEINDGQMAGLSMNDAHVLYSNLKTHIDNAALTQ